MLWKKDRAVPHCRALLTNRDHNSAKPPIQQLLTSALGGILIRLRNKSTWTLAVYGNTDTSLHGSCPFAPLNKGRSRGILIQGKPHLHLVACATGCSELQRPETLPCTKLAHTPMLCNYVFKNPVQRIYCHWVASSHALAAPTLKRNVVLYIA